MTVSGGKAAIGIEGFDDILSGGLSRGRIHVLEGNPGTGKTTIAMRFLLEGARDGEVGLYITLSESEAELRDSAASHGWCRRRACSTRRSSRACSIPPISSSGRRRAASSTSSTG
jgi:KaiC/GvpD/RAD55 family RecA-like ATPase